MSETVGFTIEQQWQAMDIASKMCNAFTEEEPVAAYDIDFANPKHEYCARIAYALIIKHSYHKVLEDLKLMYEEGLNPFTEAEKLVKAKII